MHIDLHVSIPSMVPLITAQAQLYCLVPIIKIQKALPRFKINLVHAQTVVTESHSTLRFNIGPMNENHNNSIFDFSAAICNVDNLLLKNIIHLARL